jgi:2-C-methyl-D-erythritol 4-phosphate cytidylyltransferase
MSIPVTLVTGGLRRQDSVAAGVAAVSPLSDVVLIHDGARPLATAALFDACAHEARRSGAAIVAVPVSDTLKQVADLTIGATVSREGLWGAQTPQGFRRDFIQGAIERTRIMDNEFTDEASLLEALGQPVRIVPGDRTNIKVTHPEDLELVDALLWRRSNQAQEVQR